MGIDNSNNNFQESNKAYSNQINGPHKKFIIIFSVLFLIVVIGLIIIFYPSSGDEDKNKAEDVMVQEADDMIDEHEEEEAVTKLEHSPEEIKEIDECAQKYVDLDYLALLEDDVSICDGDDPRWSFSNDEEDSIDCSDYYYLIKAVSNNDISMCDKSSKSDNGLACKGILEKDSSICNKFDGADERGFCNAYINNDPSICKQLSTEYDISSCEVDFYLVKALTSKNKDDCFEYDDGIDFQPFCISLFEGNSQTYMEGLRSLCVTS